ncbi:MAG TPA: hypothetical protein VKB27_01245 [Gammaproteobacteria bacterium]|nr:hypothetical protein [Gammaproteobacteria bacterium]
MASRKIDRLCQSILPPGYDRVEQLAPAMQQFLEQNLPEPMNRAVTLLTATDDEIVIAAYNPMVANYLRLHSTEIAQQIRETLGLEARLKFRTLPESLLQAGPRKQERAPRPVSAASADAIRRSAVWLEDEGLREALLSLARSMEQE